LISAAVVVASPVYELTLERINNNIPSLSS